MNAKGINVKRLIDMNAAQIDVKFAKTVAGSEAKIPEKRKEDAGYDVYPCFDKPFMRIKRHTTVIVPTGIASAIPENGFFKIEERGSTGSKGMKKSAGIIDSGYRGEWFIAITNTNDKDIYIAKEECVEELNAASELLETSIIIYPYEKAIAQAIIHEVISANINEISYDELKEYKSERSDGKFGSSGK